jgi:cholesterol oxidase
VTTSAATPQSPVEHFDAIVVGSGFGGSVSAYRLADAGLGVCLLERGRAYGPGDFARSPRDVGVNFWDPSSGCHGLFDVWSFRGLEALVAAGLGGGSLIYANVLLRKDERWFVDDHPGGGYDPWPVTAKDLDSHYSSVESTIGVQTYPYAETTPKTLAFFEGARRARLDPYLPPLAVTFANRGAPPVPGERIEESPNLHGRERQTCRLCGECDVGCNYGSKNTLDFTYLTRARERGADLRTLCEVVTIAPRPPGGFEVDYVAHRPDPDAAPVPTARRPRTRLTANVLVLSAGTLGTTYLLLKNRSAFPALGDALGTRFCGNGDLLTFAARCRDWHRGRRRPRRIDPGYGPVITAAARVADTLDGGTGRGFYIEDGGYPQFAAWALAGQPNPVLLRRAARFAVRAVWRRLTSDPRSDLSGEVARLLPAPSAAAALPMLGMGRDVPDGVMRLRQGWLDIDWTTATSREYFDRVRATMGLIALALGGRLRDNPLWHLKRVVTVHPVGGCPMGEDAARGVVDSRGEAFGHPGLFIADGSVMPGPVGPNPSLTIAALADRFADRMVDAAKGARVR